MFTVTDWRWVNEKRLGQITLKYNNNKNRSIRIFINVLIRKSRSESWTVLGRRNLLWGRSLRLQPTGMRSGKYGCSTCSRFGESQWRLKQVMNQWYFDDQAVSLTDAGSSVTTSMNVIAFRSWRSLLHGKWSTTTFNKKPTMMMRLSETLRCSTLESGHL